MSEAYEEQDLLVAFVDLTGYAKLADEAALLPRGPFVLSPALEARVALGRAGGTP